MDYADDVALLAELFEALVSTLEIFSVESQGLGLEVSWLKTKLQSLSDFLDQPVCPAIRGESVEVVQCFNYLVVSSHQTVNLTKMLSAESWTITKSLAEKLDAFDSQCLRKIEGICWHDFISNETVRLRTNQPPVTRRIVKQQMTFLGHASRAVPTQDVIKLLTPQPDPTWRRPRGRPRARWEDQLFPTLGELGVRDDWRVWAENRSSWRDLCGTVAAMRQTMMPAED
ncbi:hypothetical protein Bbelb_373970 [Branchiostoma belcheri]|nr:hypothetical protein Bbelb_373970 [Branchiostoma belcheri]